MKRPGYKHTEVGLIPEDWEVQRLGDAVKVQGGYAFDSKKFLSTGKYQIVKMSNLYSGKLDLDRSTSFLDNLSNQEMDYLLQHGDILITLTGTVGKKDYGYTCLIDSETNLLLNQRVARLVADERSANNKYLYYQFKNKRILDQFFFSARGGTGNQANVGTFDVEQIRIPLPPLPEQRRIATILSTWDAAIAKEQQLIDTLQTRHQGLMHQLLSGKRRLRGYRGTWSYYSLGAIAQLKVGKTPSRSKEAYWNEPNPDNIWISISDMTAPTLTNSKEKLSDVGALECRNNKVPKGTLLMSFKLTLGKMAWAGKDLYTNEAIVAIYPNRTIVLDQLLFYVLPIAVKRSDAGEAVKGKTLNQEHLQNLRFKLPDIGEQTAIAFVLNSSEKEIQIHRRRLAALQGQKKGLMQILLTGKVRVKPKNT